VTRVLLLVVAVLCCAGSIGACVARPAPDWGTYDDGTYGTVSAELSTVGPDGATYALPSTATITLIEAGDGGLAWTGTFAPGQATETFSVPVGVYAATLGGNGDAGSLWTLTRQSDGGATSIRAVLTDSMPITVTVLNGQVTPLVFHFATQTLGDVTFGTGGVGVGVALDAGAFPVSTGTVTGTATMTNESLAGSARFNTALSFSGNVGVPYTLNLTRSGGWTMAADRACAPVTGTASSTSKNVALASIFAEASGGSGTLCFGDGNLAGEFSVQLARTGAPSTTTMKSALPGGGTFEVQLDGFAPEVFDGTTLRLGSLREPFTVQSVQASELVSTGTTVIAKITSNPVGTSSVTLRR
jgi:hypothetical protein